MQPRSFGKPPLVLLLLSTVLISLPEVLAQGREDQPDFSNKYVLYPNGLSAEFSLSTYTQSPGFTASGTGDFSNCDTSACFNGVQSAYIVSYSDGDTVKVCLCDNPVMPLSEMANKHGVVPLPIRTPVVGITSASVGKGGGAYAFSGINSFFERNMTYEVFVHEASHIFDADTKSKTPDWYNAITADSCVPDDYSKASKTEDYAQVAVVWSYMVLSNQIDSPRFTCMSNQLNYLKRDLPAASLYPGTSSTPGKIPCTADWQCPTQPRAYCSNGFCECHYGFTDNLRTDQSNPGCQCATEPVWDLTGTPYCLKSPECIFDWNCGWPITCQVPAGQTVGHCGNSS